MDERRAEDDTLHLPPIGANPVKNLSQKNLSKKLQQLMRDVPRDDSRPLKSAQVKYVPKKWKELTPAQYSKLTAVEKSRYDAYEAPPKHIEELQAAALKRIREVKQGERERITKGPTLQELIEKEYNSELIGQLRAAEAKERVTTARRQYFVDKAEEIDHMISQQPTAMEAVRLKCFLQSNTFENATTTDCLNKRQRERCETILEDEKGLTVQRT